jgi:cytidylate kinase
MSGAPGSPAPGRRTAALVIAIDGPAASGKGTLARRLAAHLGLPHLDTGCHARVAP